MTPLYATLLLAGALLLWFDAMRTRETALDIARQTCERKGFQLLDQTVALRGIGLIRNRAGHLVLRRTYVFDYSTDGGDRRSGFVILAGRRLMSVGL